MNKVRSHFDNIAKDYDYYKKKNNFYYESLKKLLKKLIPPNKNILEIGCATGDLLAYLKPKKGYGYDISDEMINIAKSKYGSKKNLRFSTSLPILKSLIINHKQSLSLRDQSLDFVFMSDVIEHLEKPDEIFSDISKIMTKDSKLIVTMANPIWEPALLVWEKLGLKMPEGKHKRITFKEIEKLLEKTNLEVLKHDYTLLIPVYIPFITGFVNAHLETFFKRFAFIEYIEMGKRK